MTSLAPAVGRCGWIIDPPMGDRNVVLTQMDGAPTFGLLRAKAGAVAYWQFIGHGSDIGLWVYVMLNDEEATLVAGSDGLALDVVRPALAGRQGFVAVTYEDLIFNVQKYVVRPGESHGEWVKSLFREGLSLLEQTNEDFTLTTVELDSGTPGGKMIEAAERARLQSVG